MTDGGVAYLTGLPALTSFYLEGIQITDAGLAHLSGLTALRDLFLLGTQVTAAGVAELQKALPDSNIYP